jgi:hypothetical protein
MAHVLSEDARPFDFHIEVDTFSLKCLVVLQNSRMVDRRQQVVQKSAVKPIHQARLSGPSIALS